MIVGLKVLCLIIALILFFFAAFLNLLWPAASRINLVAGGLFFYTLRELFAD